MDSTTVYSACSSPKTWSSLAPGLHIFRVRTWECSLINILCPNTTSPSHGTPDSWFFTIDTVAPDTTITGGPPAGSTTAATDATFTYSGAGTGLYPGVYQCKLDDALFFSSCPVAGRSYSGLPDGLHTFQVRAIDFAGNVDATPASRNFTVDTTGPTTTITGGPIEGSTVTTTGTAFTFESEAGATFTCKADGGAAGPCTSPKVLDGLAGGVHTFAVTATDTLGSAGPPATRNFTVAVPAPVTIPVVTPVTTAVKPPGPCGAKTGRSLRRCLATQKCKRKYKGTLSAKKKKARAKCLAKAKKKR
ncbi:MAG: hypothetical protein WAP35_05085 [Solirubrobacterales bacterium]